MNRQAQKADYLVVGTGRPPNVLKSVRLGDGRAKELVDDLHVIDLTEHGQVIFQRLARSRAPRAGSLL